MADIGTDVSTLETTATASTVILILAAVAAGVYLIYELATNSGSWLATWLCGYGVGSGCSTGPNPQGAPQLPGSTVGDPLTCALTLGLIPQYCGASTASDSPDAPLPINSDGTPNGLAGTLSFPTPTGLQVP
jgi:hypothetical protein